MGTVAACRLTGRSRATHYRNLKPGPPTERRPRPAPPSALPAAERAAVLELLNRAEYAGRGTSTTSEPVAHLLTDLGVTRSHSRPKVSSDNPCSEAHFKTVKYSSDFPARFGSPQDAREWCVGLLTCRPRRTHLARHPSPASPR